MTNQRKSPSTLLEELIGNISPLSRQKKVQRAIEAHFQDSTQRDGRGRRASELETSCKALRHLGNIPIWLENERYDLNMRRRIRDILKHVDHGQLWSKTIQECTQARGLINKAARLRNERTEYGLGEPKPLDDRFICYPLNSAAKLRSAGKRGKNCLGRRGYDHFDELKSREAEFYEIKAIQGETRAFFRIERSSRTVTDMEGPDNSEVELPVETLRGICRELDANGDESSEFVRLGVLSMLKESSSEAQAPMCEILGFQVWWRSGEIVVKDLETNLWSRFTWDVSEWREHLDEWDDSDGSAIDSRAFELMCRCQPKLREIAEKARPTADGAVGSAPSRRRRFRHRRLPF